MLNAKISFKGGYFEKISDEGDFKLKHDMHAEHSADYWIYTQKKPKNQPVSNFEQKEDEEEY